MPLHRTARRRWRRQNSGVGVAGDAFDNGASHYRFRHRRQWRRYFHKHDPKKRRLSLVTSIEGFRAIAARTGNYRPDETEPGFVSDNALKAEPNPAGLVSCSVRVWQYAHGRAVVASTLVCAHEDKSNFAQTQLIGAYTKQ